MTLAGTQAGVEREVTKAGRRLDLPPNRVVVPGLSDGHMHLADLALSAEEIDLTASPTLEDGLARVAAAHAAAADPASWLEGHGWDAVRWRGWPTALDLERIAPGRRIALWSHDHHAVWASESALRFAGITTSTADPSGGIIRRHADGTPAGCLQEAAAALLLRFVPSPVAGRLEAALLRTFRELLPLGITAVHDPGEVLSDRDLSGGFAAYKRLGATGRLPIQVHASIRPESLELAISRGLRSGEPLGGHGSRARVGWLKIFADGTLGARTARMLAPYEPDPERGDPTGGPLGIHVTEPAEVARLARRAAANGIATQVHAIGDGAVRTSLDALGALAGRTRLMPRIEHAQLVDPADRPLFARAGIAACVLPRDIRSDALNAWRSWGRARVEGGAHGYGSLARSGAVVAFGTDAPIEPPDPWPAIASAVTRRAPEWAPGQAAFVPAEAMTLDRALRAACLDAAISAGEADRGRLGPGHRADLIVIPASALDEPVDPNGPLANARPELVLVDGQIAYEA